MCPSDGIFLCLPEIVIMRSPVDRQQGRTISGNVWRDFRGPEMLNLGDSGRRQFQIVGGALKLLTGSVQAGLPAELTTQDC
jgi:hypothetical protein